MGEVPERGEPVTVDDEWYARRGEWPADWDESLARLEDFLLAYPLSRALPDLDGIARAADVRVAFIRGDERAHKVIHDAISARPLGTPEGVDNVRTEVELLAMEVGLLTERLRDASAPRQELEHASARLSALRRQLEVVKRLL